MSVVRIVVMMGSLFAALAPQVCAKYKTEIGGITVTSSKDGALAFFDKEDGTLTIGVSESGGALKVVVGPSASFFWGGYVDIYIAADDAGLKSVAVKGSENCTPFVCGQVGFTNTFTLKNGAVGDTDFYGQDFGLGMVAPFTPAKVLLKNGYATAQVLGFPHKAEAHAEQLSGSGQRKHVQDKRSASSTTSPGKVATIERIQAGAR